MDKINGTGTLNLENYQKKNNENGEKDEKSILRQKLKNLLEW